MLFQLMGPIFVAQDKQFEEFVEALARRMGGD